MFLLDAARKLERRPDLAFVSYERWARNRPVPRTPAWDVIPDLVIEVISPSNSASGVLVKVGEYFRHGVREVWVVYPLEEQVYVYRSPTSVRVLTRSDLLESTGYPPRLPVAARAALRGAEPRGMSRGRGKPHIAASAGLAPVASPPVFLLVSTGNHRSVVSRIC